LLVPGQVSSVVINDLDPAVFAFWSTLVDDRDTLIGKLESVPLTVKEWRTQKEVYSSRTTDIDALGSATFSLNRTNRSGVLNGGPIGGLDQTGNYLIDARLNREELADRVRTLGLHREHIIVLNSDGRTVVRDYASRPDMVLYADPPYFEKAGSLYMNSLKAHDHRALAEDLNALSARRWVL
jgi:DNA adenine methylase